MGIFGSLFGGGNKQEQPPVENTNEQPSEMKAEQPEAAMEVVHSDESNKPTEGEYDSGVTFEDLGKDEISLEEQIANVQNPEMPASVLEETEEDKDSEAA